MQPESLLQIRLQSRTIKYLTVDPDPTEKPFSGPDGNSTLLPNFFHELFCYWASVLWIRESVSLTYGSGLGSDSGSFFCLQWLTRFQPKIFFFFELLIDGKMLKIKNDEFSLILASWQILARPNREL